MSSTDPAYADAARPEGHHVSSTRILTSSSDSRPIQNGGGEKTGVPSPSKALEPSDAQAMQDLLRPSVVVKPYPRNLTLQPRSLQPLMLLPREHLQLSFLDLASPCGSFSSSRFYESSIKIMDLESRMGARPVVMIARLESDKTAYALERQRNGLYTLCQLGSWVDLKALSDSATVSRYHLLKKRTHRPDEPETQPMTTPQLHNENKKRRLAIEAIQSIVKRPSRSASISTPPQAAGSTSCESGKENGSSSEVPTMSSASVSAENSVQKDASLPDPALPQQENVTAPAEAELLPQQTAEDIFSNIRNQYQEALYQSKGSLGYFAKGPMSRARAAFHLDCDSNLEMSDLIDFLKSLVMNTVQIDKKYRETIPAITSKMTPVMEESENEHSAATKSKKRKSKKMRLGKDGLYPMEDGMIEKWWRVYRPHPKDDDFTTSAVAQETKLQISCLRSRETQLQMIIILEILALEPLLSSEDPDGSQLPGLPGLSTGQDADAPKLPPKKRNRHNLPFLLDVHADRLSIWQSTALDDVNAMEDSQNTQKNDSQAPQRSTSDPLKDFCVDIIVPFFSARLPEQCDSINRKLGGPVMPSPPKSKPKKTGDAKKSKSKPGAIVKRPGLSKQPRTLDKVLTRETERNRRSISRGPSGVIALMRSASTPTLPGLKREASEPLSLSSVPRGESQNEQENPAKRRPSVLVKRRTEGDKSRKDALVKAELQDAITALRRPNRDVVGKAMEEAAARRATTSLSQLRKSKKPTQHPGFQNVVKATPAGARFRDALAPYAHSQPISQPFREDRIPSSSSMIPSSAPRKRDLDTAFISIHESPAAPQSLGVAPADRVQATPARPAAFRNLLSVPESDDPAILASSPVLSRKLAQPKFSTSKNRALGHHDSGIGMPSSPENKADRGILLAETPVKPRPVAGFGSLENFITVTPMKQKTVVAGDHQDSLRQPLRTLDGGNVTKPRVVEEAPSKNDGGGSKRVSIFERLGWDDDDIDDLL